jgi:hypothetical protein
MRGVYWRGESGVWSYFGCYLSNLARLLMHDARVHPDLSIVIYRVSYDHISITFQTSWFKVYLSR